MSLPIILGVAIVLSIAFHFIGVYADAKKGVWFVLVLLWAAGFSIATSEVKPKGYEYIKTIEGKYPDTDKLIKESLPEISLYEMILIKKSILEHKKAKD